MATGELKFFDATKGWGFITPADGSPDVFLHISAVHTAGIEKLIEGDPINYTIETNPRSGKPCAIGVSLPAPKL
jgi:CspA family cold shock protein